MAHYDRARAPRADSMRNRARILDAARGAVDRAGAEVVMADIAAEAGVAVGTLYNHFPTKADLVAAIVSQYVAEIADRAAALREVVDSGAPAGQNVQAFLEYVLEATARSNAAKLANGGITSPEDAAHEQRAGDDLDAVLHAAQTEGTLREDLTVQDLYLLVNSAPLRATSAERARWLRLVFDGLRRRGH